MTDLKLRASVTYLEESIKSLIEKGQAEDVNAQIPIEHHFTPNIDEFDARLYARQGFIPKGTTFTGKLHRHHHIVSLLQGKMAIVSEDGRKVVTAPHTWVAPSGSKRAFHALEDSVLLNVHITTIEDENLDKLEEQVIAPSYTSLGLEEPNFKLLE